MARLKEQRLPGGGGFPMATAEPADFKDAVFKTESDASNVVHKPHGIDNGVGLVLHATEAGAKVESNQSLERIVEAQKRICHTKHVLSDAKMQKKKTSREGLDSTR